MRLLFLLTVLLASPIILLAQPVNDDCISPISLGEAPSCPTDIFNNINATASNIATSPGDNIPSCWTNVNNDVWFSFTTPVDGSIVDFAITIGGTPGGPNNMPMVQTQFALYRGDCAIDDLSELLCVDFTAGQSIANANILGLDPATTYFIRVNDFSATGTPNWGDFTVCVDSISNAVDVLVTAATDSICNGNATQLNVIGADNLDFFSWEPTNSLSDPNSLTPNAFPNTTTTYTFTGTNFGDNLITNGDFEMGNTGFTTDYILGSDSLPLTQWGLLGYEGTYEVLDNPSAGHSNFASCGDHTTGSGNMMIINGSAVVGEAIWCQTVLVEPGTEYQFSAWLATVTLENPANLQFSVNGLLLGTPFLASSQSCDWQQFSSTWNSGPSVNAEICISNQNVAPSGNDFAIDDLSFSTFSEGESSLTIHVSDPEITILNQSDATCTGICDGVAEVSVTGGFENNGYTYLWSDGQTNAMATNLCAGTYNITISDYFGCTEITSVVINEAVFSVAVNEIAAPACEIQQDASVSVFIGSGTAPYIINWSSGGTGMTEDGLTNGNHSVTVEDANGCTAIQDFDIELFAGLIPVEINNTSSDSICAGETVTLTASGGNTNIFDWDTGATGETISVAPNITTTYTVAGNTLSQNLVVNGDFEQGNVGFTSGHNFHQLPSNGMCEGCYGVAPLPPDGWTQCGDHTSGTGNQMVFNAATSPGLSSWCQTITVSPNTDYSFSFWGQDLNSGASANLSATFNGTPLTGNLLLNTSCTWQQFSNNWNSTNLTSVEICINNLETNGGGNDLAIDDISLSSLCPSTTERTIYVSNLSSSIIQQMDIACENTTGSATVFVEGGFFPYSFLWDDGSTGFTNENLTGGAHTVTVSDFDNHCEEILQLFIDEAPGFDTITYDFRWNHCDPENGIDLLPNTLSIQVTGGTPPYSYSVDNGSPQSDSIFIFDTDNSAYDILVTDANGCEIMSTTPAIEGDPFPTVTIIPSDEVLCDPEIILSLNRDPNLADSIIWSNEDTTPTTAISELGIYSVSLWNSRNCLGTDTIEIKECGLYVIPNAFTPNGDGNNDHFGIVSLGDVQILNMVIYNRWGEEVYKGTNSWNGMHRGKPHPTDVLIYRIELMVQGVTEVKEGNFTLIR